MTTTDIHDVAATGRFDADTELVFGALSDAARRFVLALLVERRERAPLGELATELAARDRDVEPDEVGDDAVESAQVTLYHVHVPKLADAGLVSVERDGEAVALAADEEAIREHVELPAIDN